ncbi:hypothetical protein ACFX1R_029406 [Malus domestica]
MPQFAAQKSPSSNLNLVGFTLRGDSDYSAHAHVSPSREVLRDMAKEEWGIDGESDVEEHVEVERRLDHDLSRFKIVYSKE